MGSNMVKWLASHAEDLSLGIGVLVFSVGTGLAAGYPYGLVAFGVLSIGYGIWITPRRT